MNIFQISFVLFASVVFGVVIIENGYTNIIAGLILTVPVTAILYLTIKNWRVLLNWLFAELED